MGAENAPELISWVQYGVLGLVVVAFIGGWIWARPAVDRLVKELDEVKLQLSEQNRWVRDIIVPAITESNDLLREVNQQLWHEKRRGA